MTNPQPARRHISTASIVSVKAVNFAKIDEKTFRDQGRLYPLKSSIVTGEDLHMIPRIVRRFWRHLRWIREKSDLWSRTGSMPIYSASVL